MNKVENIYNKLIHRLPKTYKIPIKCFKTTKKMLIAAANRTGKTYKEQVNYYNKFFKNFNKANYIKTKYYCDLKKRKKKTISTALDIVALGGNPIWVSLEKLLKYSKNEIIFVLLHEVGHGVLETRNERKADLFAIRWCRKLNKENKI